MMRVVFRLFLGLLLIEVFLRCGGFIFLLVQAYQNDIRAKAKGEYQIICLGSSDTAYGGENSYPKQLERVLNEGKMGVHFKVINKGIPAASTTEILRQAKDSLDQYQPDMVIVMMGGYNEESITHVVSDTFAAKLKFLFLDRLKTYRLFKKVCGDLAGKIKGLHFFTREQADLTKRSVSSPISSPEAGGGEKTQEGISEQQNIEACKAIPTFSVDDLYVRKVFHPLTVRNANDIVETVLSHGAKLIVMQSPLRDIKSLKEILYFRKGTIFVSNETNFREAINKTCLQAYISDHWGHTTTAGNILMAENLARVIKEELLNSHQ